MNLNYSCKIPEVAKSLCKYFKTLKCIYGTFHFMHKKKSYNHYSFIELLKPRVSEKILLDALWILKVVTLDSEGIILNINHIKADIFKDFKTLTEWIEILWYCKLCL